VSWQVTGVRQDAFAEAHPVIVEPDKAEGERGFYLHPELFGSDDTGRVGFDATQPITSSIDTRAEPSEPGRPPFAHADAHGAGRAGF
jgi:hypothetical protein